MAHFEVETEISNKNLLMFVYSLNPKGTPVDILYANSSAYERLGYTFEEIILLHPADIGMPIISTSNLKVELNKLYSGEEISYPMLFFTKSNNVILANIKAKLCNYKNHKGVLTTAQEIYDHRFIKSIVINANKEIETKIIEIDETKEQLIQSGKLATIGQLAAGVAHEINNPLGYISSNIETAQVYHNQLARVLNSYEQLFLKIAVLSHKDDELINEIYQISQIRNEINLDFILKDLGDLSKDVEDGLKKISEIVNSLKTFSRVNPTLEFKEYDLNNGIKESLIVARNEIKYCAKIVESLGNIPKIMVNGNRINEVILNIILNSCYAIKNKNTTSNEKGLIKITTYVENNYIVCQIEDNGMGIEKQNLNKIFDPFFTTKPVGSGTGLGLSIAYDIIVNKHQGKIHAESTLNVGTKITIKLPH